MKCKLNLNNSTTNGCGGTFEGKGIAETLRKIREQFTKDGFIGCQKDRQEPHVFFNYSEKHLKNMLEGDDPFVATMFEIDSDYQEIQCGGFGTDDNGWTEKCEGCPYLEKK